MQQHMGICWNTLRKHVHMQIPMPYRILHFVCILRTVYIKDLHPDATSYFVFDVYMTSYFVFDVYMEGPLSRCHIVFCILRTPVGSSS